MNSLHFGAGKIGRGFIGAQLSQAGFKVTFADTETSVVEAINRNKSYNVHILGESYSVQKVEGVQAVVADSQHCVDSFISADIVTTAVSMNALPALAPIVARGLAARYKAGVVEPLNIICCENGIRATSSFKSMVVQRLDSALCDWVDRYIGFVDCCIDRIVPVVTLENPLDVAVEPFYEWCLDSSAIKGEIKNISGVRLVGNIDAYIYRKLFTLNTAHCTIAYLGALKGYKYIHEAVVDADIRSVVEGVMEECSRMVVEMYHFSAEEQANYCSKILQRFSNSALGDTVSRVSRDPMRKLSPQLYFSRPISLALQLGHRVHYLATAVAAVLRFRSDNDPQSLQIGDIISQNGVEYCVKRICDIYDEDTVAEIVARYRAIF